MKHVTILIPNKSRFTEIAISRTFLTIANAYFFEQTQKNVFTVQAACESADVKLACWHGLQPDATLDEINKTDLIIIPSGSQHSTDYIESNITLIPWLTEQRAKGAEIAVIGSGALLPAKAGLLHAKQCTAPSDLAVDFKALFPSVQICIDKTITDDSGFYSSTDGVAFLTLLCYLTEKYVGSSAAMLCSKFFNISYPPVTVASDIAPSLRNGNQDATIAKARVIIEKNLQGRMTVDDLARMLSLGRRSLERRFRESTSLPPNEYIRRVRIEVAKKHLQFSNKKIHAIMAEVGYSDAKTFRQSFQMVTGLLPKQYRKRFNHTIIP